MTFALTSDDYMRTVIALGAAYLVSAVGYNLVLGYTGQMAFGQAGFMAIGAYFFAVIQESGSSLIVAFLGAVIASVVAASVVGVAALRTRHFYLALVTLAFAEATLRGIGIWPATHGDNGIPADLFGNNSVYFAAPVAALTMLLCDRLIRSRAGRAFAMVGADEDAAAAMGVNVSRTRVMAFIISGLLGGIGGILLAGALEYISPANFDSHVTLLLMTMIVVGGLASIWGSLLGVSAILIVGQFLTLALGFQNVVYGLILFAVLIILPSGLVSLPRRLQRAPIQRLIAKVHLQRS